MDFEALTEKSISTWPVSDEARRSRAFLSARVVVAMPSPSLTAKRCVCPAFQENGRTRATEPRRARAAEPRKERAAAPAMLAAA